MNSLWVTITYAVILVGGLIDEKRRSQWYLLGIFFALMVISSLLTQYFNLWLGLIPEFFFNPQSPRGSV